MRALLVSAAPLIAMACSTAGSNKVDSVISRPDSPVSSVSPPPVAPTRTDTTPREIYIDSVGATNPLTVSGRARTFENTVQIRVRNARGEVIADRYTTSRGEMGQHNPYAVAVWLVHEAGPRITVEAFEYSAKDGSVRSLTSKAVQYDIEPGRITLMLPVGDCGELRSFTRTVPKSAALARQLVEALVAGPNEAEKAAGATSPFPRGSGVNSVVLRDGTLTVDFNERVAEADLSCAAVTIQNAVTATLRLLPTVQQVVITKTGVR